MFDKLSEDILQYEYICGVDEVGRGPLCGDVVAAAVIMPKYSFIEGVNDSKKLSVKKRDALYEKIVKEAIGIGIGRVTPDIIDDINIKNATRLAMKKAVENLKTREGQKIVPNIVLIDAEVIDLDIFQKSIIKGDQKVYAIACASIIAKVTRDLDFIEYEKKYPGYDFLNNKGYGTKKHREALKRLGKTPIHRNTFIKKILENDK